MNRDEAERCYSVSLEFYEKGEHERAIKFAERCFRMDPIEKYKVWLDKVRSMPPKTPNEQKSKAEPTTESKQQGPRRRYSSERVAEIKKICQYKEDGDLYAVLGLKKDCTDAELKKAYRKMALAYHPDKCSAPGAEDAFKAIGFAFSILKDPSKRKKYDMYGIGSTTRGGSGYSSDATQGQRSSTRQDDFPFVSAEEIYNAFFSGMMNTGPGFSYRMGGFGNGGIFTFGGNPSYQRRASAQQTRGGNTSAGMFIFIVLFFIPLVLSAIRSLFSQLEPPDFGFDRTHYLNQKQTTAKFGLDYWVNNVEWSEWLRSLKIDTNIQKLSYENGHPKKTWVGREPVNEKIKKYEEYIINDYISELKIMCNRERNYKHSEISKAERSFFQNKNKIEQAKAILTPSCDELGAFREKLRNS